MLSSPVVKFFGVLLWTPFTRLAKPSEKSLRPSLVGYIMLYLLRMGRMGFSLSRIWNLQLIENQYLKIKYQLSFF
jgi:hypothetical protein